MTIRFPIGYFTGFGSGRSSVCIVIGSIFFFLSLRPARTIAHELGQAPFLVESDRIIFPLKLAGETDSPAIDTGSRTEVVVAFHSSYLASEGVSIGWTGNAAACALGENNPNHVEATIRRVNYFRAMAGLPGVVALDDLLSQKCIKAAMMMSAEGNLSHSPGESWACYSADGAEAAAKSNIALGAEGPAAIDLYMDDRGSGNTAVGHRRWILHPPQVVMGAGSVPLSNGTSAANALWVLAPSGSRPGGREYVAWPAPGYFPHPLLPKLSSRWSFSMPNANFTFATVGVTVNGQPLTVAVESRNEIGYGDNTLVWTVAGIPPLAPFSDTPYLVTVGNVSVGGQSRSFAYAVIVIDPRRPQLEARPSGNQLTLAWPVAPTGFLLQTGTPGEGAINWSNSAMLPGIVGSEQQVTVGFSYPLQFFRLRKP